MFNLVPKKPASRPYWRLRLLTSEYLVEGSFYPDEYKVGSANIFELAGDPTLDGGGAEAFHRLQLYDVALTPTGLLTLPVQTYPEWGLPVIDCLIALIPGDEASLLAAQKAFKEFRYPLHADVYASSYRLSGCLLSDSTIPRRSPFMVSQLVPLVQAEIHTLLPAASWPGLRVDWALLNGVAFMHGYGLTAAG